MGGVGRIGLGILLVALTCKSRISCCKRTKVSGRNSKPGCNLTGWPDKLPPVFNTEEKSHTDPFVLRCF